MTYLHIEQLYHLCCKVRKGNITSLQSLVKVFMVISHEHGTKTTAKEFYDIITSFIIVVLWQSI